MTYVADPTVQLLGNFNAVCNGGTGTGTRKAGFGWKPASAAVSPSPRSRNGGATGDAGTAADCNCDRFHEPAHPVRVR